MFSYGVAFGDIFLSNTDVQSLDLSCGSNYAICLREDISEMEVSARKFEKEAEILEEVNRQARNGNDLYFYELSKLSKRVDDGYSPYCEIKFKLNCDLRASVTATEDRLQELTRSLSPEVSETTSCVASTLCSLAEPLGGSTRATVRNSSLQIVAILCILPYNFCVIN